jgi:hypothetical protein
MPQIQENGIKSHEEQNINWKLCHKDKKLNWNATKTTNLTGMPQRQQT